MSPMFAILPLVFANMNPVFANLPLVIANMALVFAIVALVFANMTLMFAILPLMFANIPFKFANIALVIIAFFSIILTFSDDLYSKPRVFSLFMLMFVFGAIISWLLWVINYNAT